MVTLSNPFALITDISRTGALDAVGAQAGIGWALLSKVGRVSSGIPPESRKNRRFRHGSFCPSGSSNGFHSSNNTVKALRLQLGTFIFDTELPFSRFVRTPFTFHGLPVH